MYLCIRICMYMYICMYMFIYIYIYIYISRTYRLFVVTPSFTSGDDLQTTVRVLM